MYIEAVVNGYCLPDVPPNVPLRAQLELLSTPELVAKLASLKALHNHTDLDTRKRIIRAIEIELHLHANKIEASPVANNVYIGIHVERDERRRRITERLHARLHEGLLDEVRQLLSAGISPENLIYYGLEYKFTVEHLTGKIAYSEMVERLNIAIHQFAKRQMTWFRGMERRGAVIHWVALKI
jgi:tRNA dimethylallyltransferase